MLNITDVKVTRLQQGGNVVGLASLTFGGQLVVTGIRVIRSKKGNLFVSMPQRKGNDNQYHDIVFPLNKQLRQHIEQVVLNEFNNAPVQGQGYQQGGSQGSFGQGYQQGGFNQGYNGQQFAPQQDRNEDYSWNQCGICPL